MKRDDTPTLGSIYAGATELFLRGEQDRAMERFKSIYEVDCTFRDVAEILDDYYDLPSDQWVTKYVARFYHRNG